MPIGGPAFSSVKKARAALKEKAEAILEQYMFVCKQAAAGGDYETAMKGYQYLLEHMPEEEGERLIDVSVDKKQIEISKGPTGPIVQIGLSIGGIDRRLPEVVEITTNTLESPKKTNDSTS